VSETSTEGVEGRWANVSGAVLLGGQSSRMERDKAHLELGGEPFATRIARLLDSLFTEVLLVGGTPPDSAPGRRVPDREGPVCALRGLVTALECASSERVVVLSTDVPLMSPDLVLALAAWPEHDAVVPRHAGQRHPLCAIYRREPVLKVARDLLGAGALRLAGVLEGVETRYLEGPDLLLADPDGRALTNVNTPEEFAALPEGS
jgi:molybdopterin-guanine dinucleotide biosynthesis protein A